MQPAAPVEATEAELDLLRRVQRWHNDNIVEGVPCGDWHVEAMPDTAVVVLRNYVRSQTAAQHDEIARLQAQVEHWRAAHAAAWETVEDVACGRKIQCEQCGKPRPCCCHDT